MNEDEEWCPGRMFVCLFFNLPTTKHAAACACAGFLQVSSGGDAELGHDAEHDTEMMECVSAEGRDEHAKRKTSDTNEPNKAQALLQDDEDVWNWDAGDDNIITNPLTGEVVTQEEAEEVITVQRNARGVASGELQTIWAKHGVNDFQTAITAIFDDKCFKWRVNQQHQQQKSSH